MTLKYNSQKYRRTWTDQEILDAIRDWAAKHGRPPKFKEWEAGNPDYPTSFTVRVRCGSWNDAMVMAGFDPRPSRPQLSFDLDEAIRLRNEGLSYQEVGKRLKTHPTAISYAIRKRLRAEHGPPPEKPRKPRNAAERREARIAALQRALAKNK